MSNPYIDYSVESESICVKDFPPNSAGDKLGVNTTRLIDVCVCVCVKGMRVKGREGGRACVSVGTLTH